MGWFEMAALPATERRVGWHREQKIDANDREVFDEEGLRDDS
jgi:hypothetical protein